MSTLHTATKSSPCSHRWRKPEQSKEDPSQGTFPIQGLNPHLCVACAGRQILDLRLPGKQEDPEQPKTIFFKRMVETWWHRGQELQTHLGSNPSSATYASAMLGKSSSFSVPDFPICKLRMLKAPTSLVLTMYKNANNSAAQNSRCSASSGSVG